MTRIALVLGGARSGKSAFAEALLDAEAQAAGLSRRYLATARSEWDGVRDTEFERRIAEHRARRGPDWRTLEASDDLPRALTQADDGDGALLVDCLTLWLSYHLMEEDDAEAATSELLETLGGLRSPTVLVSNEVGMGLVPDTALGRRFRDAQGRLNQRVAQAASLVVFVAAGLPMTLKGDLRNWRSGD